MKRFLILSIFLMSSMLSFGLSFASQQQSVTQAAVCAPANPPTKFYTPAQLRAGLGSKLDKLCADGRTYCSADSTCCGGDPADPVAHPSKCSPFVDAVCCGSDGKYSCPHGDTCSPSGASCIAPGTH